MTRTLLLLAAIAAWQAGAPAAAEAAEAMRLTSDGATIAGRNVTCGRVRTRLDAHLPNLGIAVPEERLLVLNPALLRREPGTVQLFVYHHECGHHHVGGSELGADCFAVEHGVRDGWLGAGELAAVCRSFGNMPETPTHPASRRRCANLDRCFATATAAVERQRAVAGQSAVAQPAVAPRTTTPAPVVLAATAPRLLKTRRLLWSGRLASARSAYGNHAGP